MEAATLPPPETKNPTDEAILALLVVILLSRLSLAETVAQVQGVLVPLGIPPAAAAQATQLTYPHFEVPVVDVENAASTHILATRPARQAAYLRAAAERIAADAIRIVEPGQEPGENPAFAAERRYLEQHLNAERARAEAARKVDEMAAEFGPVLSWISVRDEVTTSGCRDAHGKAFHAARPPVVEGQPGYPGTLHGGSCRCSPGPPVRGAEMLAAA